MTTTTLVGSTGFVGSHILKELLAHESISSVYAYARRDIPNPTASPKLTQITSSDTSTWPAQFPRETSPKIFFSALGTTRAAAGGLEGQRKIDLDLNYDLAKAALDAGVDTYVLISSGGGNATSMMPYLKMKGELEEKVKGLGFKHCIVLKPGMIMGNREESRPAEAVVRGLAGALKKISPALTNFWGQDASTIGKAAVVAGLQCAEGKKEGSVWEIGQAEIVKLGK